MARLVQGVGVNERTRITTINQVQALEYSTWKGMLKRCYCNKYKKLFPTYEGCTVSEKFKSYEYFYDWCQQQVGFGNSGWQLDKDLLLKGNKFYSEDLCIFIPQEINYAIRIKMKKESNLPVGVDINPWSGKYIASINSSRHGDSYLGTYDDPYQAFLAYKKEKELRIRNLAESYLGFIDDRAYNALINFNIEYSY